MVGGHALAMGCGSMVVMCARWRRGDWVAIPSMAARRGLRLRRGGYGRAGASAVHGKNDWAMGGPARRRQWDSCVLDCCEACIVARGCVSFCGSNEIFSSMAEALIGEGIAARTMRMQR